MMDILLGGSYRQKGEKDKALEYFQKALAIDLALM
jgi:tetratricopeptide (TPR) repeat protein